MELKLSQTSLPATIFGTSFKQFSILAQTWKKLRIRRLSWKGQDISKNIWVHVVKQGETLTFISNLYGLPILEIAAANKDIVDFDLVFEEQYVNIPSTTVGVSQVCHFDRDKSQQHQLPKAAAPRLRFHGGQWVQIINVALPRQLSHVNATGSMLLLVPLLAFCVRFIIGALQNRVARNLRHRQSENHYIKPYSERRRTVLSDTNDKDKLDAECQREAEGGLPEDRERTHYEDLPHNYAKLESDYQKFLDECGMSKYGYFRGGSPE